MVKDYNLQAINAELRERAVALGLCDKWQKDWSDDKTQLELIEMFKRGIDFCIEHDYPSLDAIRGCFPEPMLAANGIYTTGRHYVNDARNGVYVLCGDCNVTLRFKQNKVATVFVRQDAKARIVAEGISEIFVRAFDGSDVDCVHYGAAKVKLLRK